VQTLGRGDCPTRSVASGSDSRAPPGSRDLCALQHPQPRGRGVQFRLYAVLQNSSTPARNASRSVAGGPSLRVARSEDSLSAVAQAPRRRPLNSASQARRAPQEVLWRRRKDDHEDEYEAPCERFSFDSHKGVLVET
jgi:hypothetical protein